MHRPPPRCTLFPYTTLFRSLPQEDTEQAQRPAEEHPEGDPDQRARSEEHTSELQSRGHLVCRLLLEKKKGIRNLELSKSVDIYLTDVGDLDAISRQE